MPLTIVETVGGASANSYCTLAEALTYADALFPVSEASAFALADPDTQKRALIAAAKTIDQQRPWLVGERATDTQALEFPRAGILKLDGLTAWDDDVIPLPVKDAQARLALYLVKQQTSNAGPPGMAGLTGLKAISTPQVSLTFDDRAGAIPPLQQFFAAEIVTILGNLVRVPQSRMVRA